MIETLVREVVRKGVDKMPPGPKGKPKLQGVKEIHLDANENQYGPSPIALKAMKEAAEMVNTYPTPAGNELAEKLAAFHGLKPENIVLGNGSSTILEKVGTVFLNPGDEVITCLPTFMIYIMIMENCEAKPVICKLTEDKKFDLKAMQSAITDKTKMIWICNPNNPTGTVVDSDELEAFIRNLPEHIITLVDEAYIDYAQEGQCRSMISLIQEKNVIVTRTFSKIYGLAGVRVGYAVANEEICKYLRSQIMMFNINKIGIAGAYASLDDREYYENCRKNHISDRRYMTEELTRLGFKVYDSQASFLYMDPPESVSVEAVNDALRERGIYTNMSPGNIRISLGTTEQNRYVIQCLDEILQ